MGIEAAIIGGGIGSALIGSRSASKASKAQSRANDAAIAEQRRQFDEILNLTAPQRQVGNQAMNAIAQLLGLPGASQGGQMGGQGGPLMGVRGGRGGRDMNFIRGLAGGGGSSSGMDFDAEGALANLPGNEVIVNDMMRRIQQSSPTTGGNVLAALSDRVGGFQSDRLFNSLFQLAGFGPSGTNMATNAAGNTGNAVSNLMQSSGLANASGIMGAGNSINSGLQNVLQFFAMQNMMGGGGGGGSQSFSLPSNFIGPR